MMEERTEQREERRKSLRRLIALLTFGALVALPPWAAASTGISLWPYNPFGTFSLSEILCRIAESIFVLAVAAAVLAFLIAAFFYLTSGGNESRLKRAKDALVYVVIGLAVAMLAWGAAFIIASILSGGFDPGLASC